VFGTDSNKGLRLKGELFGLEVVTIGENGVTVKDILVHDETNKPLAMMLATLEPPTFPVALGVLYCNPGTAFEVRKHELEPPSEDVHTLLRKGRTWTVE
jgi:2-oxoglutarate ferredoxin oxidoreductase subunit beta